MMGFYRDRLAASEEVSEVLRSQLEEALYNQNAASYGSSRALIK
jgi:hypothetical protein